MNIFDTIGISAALWLTSLAFFIYHISRRDPRISKLLKNIPGPPDFPFLGNLSVSLKLNTPEKFYQTPFALARQYGPVVRLWAGNKPYVVIFDAAISERILTSHAHLEKSEDYGVLRPWIFDSLFLSKPPKWNARRKLLTPAFHYKILQDCTAVFNEKGNTLVSLLHKETSSGYFNIAPYIINCTLDIICETAMGVRFEAQEQSGNKECQDYLESTNKLGAIYIAKTMQPLYWIEPIWNLTSLAKEEKKCLNIVHTFTSKVIQERRIERQKSRLIDSPLVSTSNPKKRQAFLDLLMDATEHDPNFTDADLHEETEVFIVAGQETTATTILWTLFLLALHPEYQSRVQDEIESVTGPGNPELNFSDIHKLSFLDACIKESLRMFPPGTNVSRKLGEDIVLDDGIIIPKGVPATIAVGVMQRDPKYFPEPNVFNPHRFLDESSSRHLFAYIPFSAGPRNCIGQKFAYFEMKVLFFKILSNFTVKTQQTLQTIRPGTTIVTKPGDGNLFLKLTPRVNTLK